MGKVIILPTGKPGQELRSALLPKRRRRWNRRKAANNLRSAVGIAAATLFVVWMLNSIAVAWFSSWILKGVN